MKMRIIAGLMMLILSQGAMAIMPKKAPMKLPIPPVPPTNKELHFDGTVSRSTSCKTGFSFTGSSHDNEGDQSIKSLCVTVAPDLAMGANAQREYQEDLVELRATGVVVEAPTVLDFLLANEATLQVVQNQDVYLVKMFDLSGED